MPSLRQLNFISQVLYNENIKLSDLICAYINGTIESYELTGPAYALREELCQPSALNKITRALLTTPQISHTAISIARNITVRSYIREFGSLLMPSAGFHFNVAHATPSQFSQFSSVKMAQTFEELCPTLWRLFGVLLNTTAVQNAAVTANDRGDYLTEITYREGSDTPAPIGKRSRAAETVSETVEDMPDEDWGRQSENEDSADEGAGGSGERIGTTTTAVGAGAPEGQKSNIWSASTGAPW
jgi:hypothetical protein